MRNIFCSCFLYYGDDDCPDNIPEEAETTCLLVQRLSSDQDPTYGGGDDGGDASYIKDETATNHKLQGYTVLSEADIRLRQEKYISRISTDLSISRVSAIAVLCSYNWSAGNVLKAWFDNEEEVRSSYGLLRKPTVQYPNFKLLTCLICLKRFFRFIMHAAACGHPFCKSCWKGYISTSIKEGAGCLTLKCPDPSCNAAVGQDMIYLFASNTQKKRYSLFLLRSYVECNRNIKWCPARGCDYAVEYNVVDSASYDVCCKCTYKFCWNCCVEVHHPVDCSTAANWMAKNSAESERTNWWILANSKTCPNCKCPIEKNSGCIHMTCKPPCNYQFCWLCLGGWAEHFGKATYSQCYLYEDKKKMGKYVKTEETRMMASIALARYTRFYEEWSTHETSRIKASESLQRIVQVMRIQYASESKIKLITDAWLQIIEGRRVLKWSYAYGYYVPEHEHRKSELLQNLRGTVESGLIRLQLETEYYLDLIKKFEGISNRLTEFFILLVDLTVVARDSIENIVQALENNLADVNSITY